MKKIILTPGMTKKQFKDATGLKVTYCDKNKNSISFKMFNSFNKDLEAATNLKNEWEGKFSGCEVKLFKSKMQPYWGADVVEGYTVRILIPKE